MKPRVDRKPGLAPAGEDVCRPGPRGDLDQVGSDASASPERTGGSGPRGQSLAALRITRRFGAPAERVFDAWLDPQVAGRWLFATASRPMAQVEIDARVEGKFCFVDRRGGDTTEYSGEYIEIVPHRRLVFILSMGKHPRIITRITVEIAPLKKGCDLTLTHENVPQDHANYLDGRWTGVLYGLGVTLDETSTAFHYGGEP